MAFELPRLHFGLARTLPLVLQSEAAECGLACLTMVAGYHGYRTDLRSLRQRFSISLKGVNLRHLMDMGSALNLSSRPLRLDLEELGELRIPCILHWDLNHFVVLKQLLPRGKGIVIHDPARGELRLPLSEVSRSFTGVALELSPTPEFVQREAKSPLRLRDMMGQVVGLKRSLAQILILALALEVFALMSPFLMQWTVDFAIVTADRDLVTVLVLGFGLLMLVQTAIGLMRSWVVLYMSAHLNLQWVANVFTQLLRLPVSYFEKRHLGDVVSRFGAVGQIQPTLTTSFIEALLDGLMAVATLAMMLVYSLQLATVVLVSIALYGALRWLVYRPFRRAKTTLFKVMLGLFKPPEGEVLIGGIPLEHLGPRNYRALIGAVMQDDALLAGSILDNISFFDPQTDRDRAEECARMACLHEEIEAMPMGYQTLIGDLGTSLSGGQKQRLLLARALYKKPKILFLDEATSHLDLAMKSRSAPPWRK